ncbi:Bbox zinc finger domain containing protein [Acanthamoeba castellanii str. Neff]|uniref:Bbox zinc finger domain containing protein n=1 Tax=Acanthamoeba castellanii (strain ATCC 30010 / Neff) TaxID=1257118 RepID=L8GRG5_ACACF|nr:Bbox zinc finger domain containing protein [Acanthamoeba castellanii str. Neff]ELR15754.1 Bbox zinc finger domain containing protein [Acanthamoeba castellanii str. Neff]
MRKTKKREMNHHQTLAAAAAAEEEDVGTCSICFLAFSASEADRLPRLLKCGHSFCTACLTRLLGSTTPAPTTNAEAEAEAELAEAMNLLRCPKCRTVTRVRLVDGEAAAEGVKGLPRNFDLIDLLSSSSSSARSQKQQPRPSSGRRTGKASAALKCANCDSHPAEKFCEQCSGAHLSTHSLRYGAMCVSADAPEPRAACEHHRAKKVEMWCERDGVAVCVVCLVAGPHKGHDALTIEEAELRVRERVELAQVEAAMGEVEAGEQESGREARAAIKQHFDRMR